MGAALSHKPFRRVFIGTMSSNIGVWMQNVTLLALAYELTGNATYASFITFAQLGPMLFLSPFGGAIADRVNRRYLMVGISLVQSVLSIVLSFVATSDTPNQTAIVLIVGVIGIGAAMNAPAANAVLPELVGQRDLKGAIALNSAAMNGSRVVGPIFAAIVATVGDPALAFRINAATYAIVIFAILTVEADFSPKGDPDEKPLQKLLGGLREARRDRVVGRVLTTIATFSFFCLIFIYQMQLISAEQFGLDKSGYNLMIATFGFGALSGALLMGSVLSHLDRPRMVKLGLAVFSVTLSVYATTSVVAVGFAAVFLTGVSYFVMVTALLTILQLRLRNEVRGRVMGLWMMAWAGLLPVGSLVSGPVIDQVGMTTVLLIGAGVAALLAVVVNLREPNGGAAVDITAETHATPEPPTPPVALAQGVR
jgi:MFS family permease